MSEDTYNFHLAQWVIANKKAAGISFCQLAAEINIHRNTLDRWLHGRGNCSAYHLYRMQEFFESRKARKAA